MTDVEAPKGPVAIVHAAPVESNDRAALTLLAAGVVLLLLPYVVGDRIVPAMVLAGIWAIAAAGLNTLAGRAGLVSLGQAGLVAVSAYGTAYAAARWSWPAEAALLFGLAICLLVAMAAAPICRLQGFYLATATLAFALIVQRLLVAQQSITGGPNGFGGIPSLSLFGFDVETEWQFYVLVWAVALAAVGLNRNLLRSRLGRGLDAIRSDESTAMSAGVAGPRYKQIAWLLSAAHAAVAGSLYAYYNRFLTPEQFDLSKSIELIAGVVIGGAGTMLGPLVGVVAIDVLPEQFHLSGTWSAALTPALLVAFASFFPGGLVPGIGAVASGLKRRVVRR